MLILLDELSVKKVRYSKQEIELMKELYGQGKALREIAEALKRPQNSIRNKLSELGAVLP